MDPKDLYGLPRDRFVAERAALAKELRQHGERDHASRVAKLAKPSVSAWAVNQLVRTQAAGITDLLDAGDALQRTQQEVVAGRGSPSALREAGERERAAVEVLSETARGLLSSEGHGLSGATLERVSETLHAAALDADAREKVKEGCLVRELRHVGLGPGSSGGLPPSDATPAPRSARRRRRDDDTANRERAAREQANAVASARKDEKAARRAAERAARELHSAQQRRDRAAESLSEAEAALHAAREHASAATDAHQRAKDALETQAPPP